MTPPLRLTNRTIGSWEELHGKGLNNITSRPRNRACVRARNTLKNLSLHVLPARITTSKVQSPLCLILGRTHAPWSCYYDFNLEERQSVGLELIIIACEFHSLPQKKTHVRPSSMKTSPSPAKLKARKPTLYMHPMLLRLAASIIHLLSVTHTIQYRCPSQTVQIKDPHRHPGQGQTCQPTDLCRASLEQP